MRNIEKAAKLATKLLRLTSTNEITWELKDPPEYLASGSDSLVPLYFETEYKGKTVAIYEIRTEGYIPDFDKFYWEENARLALLDDQERFVWSTEGPTPGLYNLMSLVKERASGIDDLLDDLIKDHDA